VRIEIHPLATAEMEKSTRWYAKRSVVASLGFVAAVAEGIAKITATPDRYAKIDRQFRGCSLIRYPFQLVYRFEAERVQVIAIAHAKRRPGYWKRREFE
jgi:plasmid stabilization system protein ParE